MSFPGKYDLKLYRGDTYTWRFRLWTDDARTDPTDLTDATANAEIRDKPNGLTIMVLECVITLPNIIDVALEADLWDSAPGGGQWDLQLTHLDGTVQTVVAGRVTITADVTGSTPALAAVAGVRAS